MPAEEFGHYAETFATPAAQSALAFALAHYINLVVATIVREWDLNHYGTRTTSQQEYLDAMNKLTTIS